MFLQLSNMCVLFQFFFSNFSLFLHCTSSCNSKSVIFPRYVRDLKLNCNFIIIDKLLVLHSLDIVLGSKTGKINLFWFSGRPGRPGTTCSYRNSCQGAHNSEQFQDISPLGGGRKKCYYVKKRELSL